MSEEYYCAECDEWNVNCSCKASEIIKALRLELASTKKMLDEASTRLTDHCNDRDYVLKCVEKKLLASDRVEKELDEAKEVIREIECVMESPKKIEILIENFLAKHEKKEGV